MQDLRTRLFEKNADQGVLTKTGYRTKTFDVDALTMKAAIRHPDPNLFDGLAEALKKA